jgi:hypothetical protein
MIAAAHSRTPVSPAAETEPNIRTAMPAPICTLRMPAGSRIDAGTRRRTSCRAGPAGACGGAISGYSQRNVRAARPIAMTAQIASTTRSRPGTPLP